jgi:diacylglycerol O-acyltransferase
MSENDRIGVIDADIDPGGSFRRATSSDAASDVAGWWRRGWQSQLLHFVETAIADPRERLTAIVDDTSACRDTADSSSSARLMDLVGTVPTTLIGLAVKAASAVSFSGPAIANTTVSNVPGPTDPIYFAGARLLRVTGLGPLIGGMNLFHIVASYNGTVSIGVTADRSALPDPGHYADCMQSAFEEMLSAAGWSA